MRTITLKTAQTIAADWHGGQWSALYAFASGGEVQCTQGPLCLAEIAKTLSNSHTRPVQAKRLLSLKRYLEVKCKQRKVKYP